MRKRRKRDRQWLAMVSMVDIRCTFLISSWCDQRRCCAHKIHSIAGGLDGWMAWDNRVSVVWCCCVQSRHTCAMCSILCKREREHPSLQSLCLLSLFFFFRVHLSPMRHQCSLSRYLFQSNVRWLRIFTFFFLWKCQQLNLDGGMVVWSGLESKETLCSSQAKTKEERRH